MLELKNLDSNECVGCELYLILYCVFFYFIMNYSMLLFSIFY